MLSKIKLFRYLVLEQLCCVIVNMNPLEPCFGTNCMCSKTFENASCSGLTFVPALPGYVKELVLQSNFFSNISSQFLANVSKNSLRSLTFKQNSIQFLSDNTFENLTTLSLLRISQENLDVENVRKSLNGVKWQNLSKIYLEQNNWKYLPLDMFFSPCLQKVVSISLSGNKIYNFSTGMFTNMRTLNFIDFSQNRLVTFSFSGTLYTKTLNLAKNDIVFFPSFCRSRDDNSTIAPRLQEIDLTGNALSHILPHFYKCLPYLDTLRLNSNRFTILRNDSFKELPRLQRLFIQQNLLLKYIEPMAFNSESLVKLYFGYNNFRFDYQTNKRFDATNIFKHLPKLEFLDLTSNYLPSDNSTLTHMFRHLGNLKNLTLQSVGLRKLHVGVFGHLKYVQKIILQGNFLEFWSDGIFDGLYNLKYLNLQDNMIHLLNETSISSRVLSRLEKLDLSRNPFSCTCDLMWFRKWLQTTNVSLGVNFPKQYKCAFPIEMQSQLLIHYNPTTESCTPWDPLFTMVIVMSAFGFLVLAIIVIFYKCHANIRNYFYLLRLHRLRQRGYLRLDNSEDFEFHAFVVYCEADSDWVHKVFVKRMENRGIKLCIHHREFDCGTPITENIDKYMNKSWKIVVVMSNAFASSEWCQWEVDYVQERRRRHGKDASILIMLKTIDADHMTSSIRALLLMTPYLRYRRGIGEEMFWGAVVDSLQRPLSVPPMAI